MGPRWSAGGPGGGDGSMLCFRRLNILRVESPGTHYAIGAPPDLPLSDPI